MVQHESTDIDHRFLLRRNLLLWSIIVAITPMILVSCIILYQFKMSYHEKINAHLEELVNKHKQNIDAFLMERLSDVQALASNFSFREMSDEKFLNDLLKNLQQSHGPIIVDLGVINARGIQVAYAGPFKLGDAHYSKADWFQKALDKEYYKSDVFLGLRGLPHFIVAELPAGISGLLIAAIIAAAMSSVDTSLNSSATLLLCDVYKRYWRKDAGERESMLVLYGATLMGGLIGTGAAVAMTSVRSALDAWWQLSGIFSGGMLGLFLLGMLARRAGNAAAGVGVTVGILVITWMTLSLQIPDSLAYLRSPFHGFMTTVIGTLMILLVGVGLSRLLPWKK